MLNLSCHCGQSRVETRKRPDFVHQCNCTLCRKTGARWGYFQPSEVRVAGAEQGYCRDDKDDPAAEIRFCATCGVATDFVLTASAARQFGDSLMGVNLRVADERDLAGIELRYPDGQAWSGQGDFGYVRAARILGRDARPA